MPSKQEILSSLYGALRVLRMDPAALNYFNQSVEGFWRSFFALVLAAPVSILVIYINITTLPEDAKAKIADPNALVAGHALGFLVAWAAYPIAMIWMSRLLRVSHRYVVYIIVWNWANVIGTLIVSIVMVLFWLGILSVGLAGYMSIFAFGYVLFYFYLVARLTLECNAVVAIGLVVFEVALERVIDLAVSRVVYAGLS